MNKHDPLEEQLHNKYDFLFFSLYGMIAFILNNLVHNFLLMLS